MEPLSLDGTWRLHFFPEGSFPIAHPDQLSQFDVPSVPAEVPGNVELDLQRAGLLPDPFFGNTIFALRQYETYEWWYVRQFTLPDAPPTPRWQLTFSGLDTLATVWVNGVEIGSVANMLIEHSFDVSAALRWGESNAVAVRLKSPLNEARRRHYDPAAMSWEHRLEGVVIRKPPHVWGWDIMPRAVSAGLWRPVALEPVAGDAIETVHYWTKSLDAQGATLGAHFQFRTDAPVLEGTRLHFEGICGDHTFAADWPVEFIADSCTIRVPAARLWWPQGYGEPNLYTVTASLYQGDRLLARRADRIGIRTLAVDFTDTAGPFAPREPAPECPSRLDTAPDPAHHFVITVNGVPIQVKGTNWVPLDAFHSRDASRVAQALALAADLGCNMIRCWGGNVYEDHAFFDRCDEQGIMVWQDFAFACCLYPHDDEFLARVRAEVRAVAEKLRNHPSLAVWCGDNEIDAFYVSEGLDPAANRLTRQTIPQELHRCDPHRAYIPSSPYYSPAAVRSGAATAEQHLWGPRGYFKSPFYSHHSAHFIGEIGYHGCPNVSSLKRFLSPDKLWPWEGNDEWQTHSVYHWQHQAIDRDRIRLMADQVRELFGHIPDDLETFALASQIVQAEAKKAFIESTRLRKWQTSGILWWNLLDGWPQFSDAVVDYYFGKKLAYHTIWRVQRPLCVIVGEAGQGKYLPVVVCNDSRTDAKVRYRVWDADTQETLAEGEMLSPANQNRQVARIRAYASDQRLTLIEWQVGDRTYGNHYLSGTPPFDLDRYTRWLRLIADLPPRIDFDSIAK